MSAGICRKADSSSSASSAQLLLLGEREEVPASPPTGCRYHPQWETVLVLASSGYPCWAQFCGKRESGSEWGHSKCETLRGYCLERDEVPSLLLQAGPASSSIGDSFDLSP